MTFLFLILVITAIGFWSHYGIKCGKIRIYVKNNHKDLYSEKQLDGFSLMLGPPDVAWNAQKYILLKHYADHEDSQLVEMCNSAYRSAIIGIFCFIFLFVIMIVSNV